MAQVEEELDADKNLDESVFNSFGTGELDLPSEADEDEEMSEEVDDQGDLDDYYRELGIDPAEMRPKTEKSKSSSSKSTGEYVTREKKETNE